MRGVPGAAPSLASGAVSPVSVPSPRACMKRDGQMGWSGEGAPSKPGSRPLCDVPPPHLHWNEEGRAEGPENRAEVGHLTAVWGALRPPTPCCCPLPVTCRPLGLRRRSRH